MVKLRKQRKRKAYRYNVNRKRMKKKIYNQGKIACKEIKDAWVLRKSVRSNMESMGLCYDPNKSVGAAQPLKRGWAEEVCAKRLVPSKAYVAEQLEREAKAPRDRLLRLPNSQVHWITYLMDKYGTDYKAMARDRKNYYQETWKQLRAKIRRFMSIPEQYSVYLQERGQTPSELPDNFTSVDDDD